MRGWLARVLGVAALCAVLYDGSACLIALASAPPADAPAELEYRVPCPCGCAQHLSTLIGVGLSQPAAPQAVASLPDAPKPVPPVTPDLRLPSVPPDGVDHVPISLA